MTDTLFFYKEILLFPHLHKVKGLVAQLCLTLCDFMDYSLPGSSVHEILQAGILELVVILFSRSSQPRDQTWLFCIAGRFSTIGATREAHLHELNPNPHSIASKMHLLIQLPPSLLY